MSTAPQRGGVTLQSKEKPPRGKSEGLQKSGYLSHAQNSADLPENQARHVTVGKAVLTTTRPDEPFRHRSAAAVAARILAQMKRLHRAGGLPAGDQRREELWLDVAISQLVLIRASRPKWTLSPMAWAKKYVPDLYARKTAAWIEERVQDHTRDRRYYTSATIGGMLQVTHEQFFALRLWHLWPAGISAADRKRLSLDIKAEWEKADRVKKGATPREQALCNVHPRLPGESRSAFYRRMGDAATLG